MKSTTYGHVIQDNTLLSELTMHIIPTYYVGGGFVLEFLLGAYNILIYSISCSDLIKFSLDHLGVNSAMFKFPDEHY